MQAQEPVCLPGKKLEEREQGRKGERGEGLTGERKQQEKMDLRGEEAS